jgi:hypothetical protein
MTQFVAFKKLIGKLRYGPDPLPPFVRSVIDIALQFAAPFLFRLDSHGFTRRVARFLDASTGKSEVVPPDFRLLQLAGLLLAFTIGGSVHGHFSFPPSADGGQPSVGFISPNTTFHREVSATSGPVNQADIDAIKSSAIVVYAFGSITYTDIFARSHQTTFCMFLMTDLKSYQACGEHNEGN